MFEKYDIKEIRILVTSSELEFETEDAIREFLEYTLPKEHEGQYWYRERGIDVNNKDILVLFWYKNKAVGCGILHDRTKFQEKDEAYSGIMHFYPETIFNISEITEEEIHNFSDMPKQILQGFPKIDINSLEDILNLIYEKWRDYPGN